MALEYFEPGSDNADVVAALKRDGAAVVRNQISDELANAVLADLRTPFDEVGRFDESDFNGYKTLRVSSILRDSIRSAEIVAHQRVLDIADAFLLKHCSNYRIGSLTAIEILPGETDQYLHTDDSIYPLRIPGMQLQISALWSLTDFTHENGATRVIRGSHLEQDPDKYYNREGETDEPENVVQAVMPKGSLLLYLGTTWHGGGANRTNEPRAGLVNTYALGWLRQEENMYLQVPREIADTHPQVIRDLLGYRKHRTLGAYQNPDGSWI